jgi:hypothetical protein
MLRLTFVVLMLIGLSGCQLNTKVPDPLPESLPIEAKTSWISVPIVISSNEIRAILQRTISESLVDGNLFKESGRDLGYDTHLQTILRPNGPVSASASDGSVKLQIPLIADLYVNWKTCRTVLGVRICAGHHEAAQGAFTVLVDMKPEITAGYGVNPNVDLTYNLDKPVSFTIGPVTVNLVSVTREAINNQLTSFQKTINTEYAGKLPLREAAEKAWAAAANPILVSQENNFWLTSRLEELNSAPLTTEGDKAILNLGFSGKFSALVGDPPAAQAPSPLPPLKPTAAPSGFVLNMPLTLQFVELEKRVNTLPAFSYNYKGNVITVKKMALSSTRDGKLSLGFQVNLSTAGKLFDKSGWVYLTGTPVYDQTGKRVVFQHLGYTAQTESVLLSKAAWAVEPLVVAVLKDRAYIEISDYLSNAQAKVNAFVTSIPVQGVGTITGHLDSLAIENIIVQQQNIVIVTNAEGSMAMTIEGVASK